MDINNNLLQIRTIKFYQEKIKNCNPMRFILDNMKIKIKISSRQMSNKYNLNFEKISLFKICSLEDTK